MDPQTEGELVQRDGGIAVARLGDDAINAAMIAAHEVLSVPILMPKAVGAVNLGHISRVLASL